MLIDCMMNKFFKVLPAFVFVVRNAPKYFYKEKNRKKRKQSNRWRGKKAKRKRNKCRRLPRLKIGVLCRSLLAFFCVWLCVSHLTLLFFFIRFVFLFGKNNHYLSIPFLLKKINQYYKIGLGEICCRKNKAYQKM